MLHHLYTFGNARRVPAKSENLQLQKRPSIKVDLSGRVDKRKFCNGSARFTANPQLFHIGNPNQAVEKGNGLGTSGGEGDSEVSRGLDILLALARKPSDQPSDRAKGIG